MLRDLPTQYIKTIVLSIEELSIGAPVSFMLSMKVGCQEKWHAPAEQKWHVPAEQSANLRSCYRQNSLRSCFFLIFQFSYSGSSEKILCEPKFLCGGRTEIFTEVHGTMY